jgi:hypothetical protein
MKSEIHCDAMLFRRINLDILQERVNCCWDHSQEWSVQIIRKDFQGFQSHSETNCDIASHEFGGHFGVRAVPDTQGIYAEWAWECLRSLVGYI